MLVRITNPAAEQIDEIETWWKRNRKSSRTGFVDHVLRAIEQIEQFPESGAPIETEGVVGVRRIVLSTGHSLYYRLLPDYARVVGIWHDALGTRPTPDELAREAEAVYGFGLVTSLAAPGRTPPEILCGSA